MSALNAFGLFQASQFKVSLYKDEPLMETYAIPAPEAHSLPQ